MVLRIPGANEGLPRELYLNEKGSQMAPLFVYIGPELENDLRSELNVAIVAVCAVR